MPFKVLIAGGSLTGLTLALALERAGIDFDLLERREIGPQLGASICIHPQTIRIFDQLGVWKDLQPIVVPLGRGYRFESNGELLSESYLFQMLEDTLHQPSIFIERNRLLRILYSHIRNKAKVHENTQVVSYVDSEDGVAVTTEDGRSFRADILVGADGVHSSVRKVMSENMRKDNNERLSKEINEGFTSEYKALFGISHQDPNDPYIENEIGHGVTGDHFSTLVAGGKPDLVFWFLFAKTARSRSPKLARFDEKDAEAMIQKYGDAKHGTKYTFRDLWDRRISFGVTPMEEGVLKSWSCGRALLLGDSAHKVTINSGFGGNLCVEAVAHLTNHLVPLLKDIPNPSQQNLTDLFRRFDETYRPRVTPMCAVSAMVTRYDAQDTWFSKLHARYIKPWTNEQTRLAPFINFLVASPWLEFLPLSEDDVDWPVIKADIERKSKRSKAAQNWSTFGSGVVLTVAVAAVVSWRYWRR